MTMYVAEINGRGIVAFNAENRATAEITSESQWFRSDLVCLDNDEGQPLWNGKDEIFLREAFPEERAEFGASQSWATQERKIEDEDDWLMYLVPVVERG